MITFVKMISNMDMITISRETANKKVIKKPVAKKQVAASSMEPKKVQTVLRIRPELMARLKYKAAQVGLSVNADLEGVIQEAVMPRIPKLPKDFEISPLVKSLNGIIPAPTQEMLDADPKLAYIVGKGGK